MGGINNGYPQDLLFYPANESKSQVLTSYLSSAYEVLLKCLLRSNRERLAFSASLRGATRKNTEYVYANAALARDERRMNEGSALRKPLI